MTVSPNVFFTLSFSMLEIRPGCSSLGPNNDNFRMTVLWGARIVQDIKPMLDQCWSSIYDTGPALAQQWVNVSCLLERCWWPTKVSRLSPPPDYVTNVIIKVFRPSSIRYHCRWDTPLIRPLSTCTKMHTCRYINSPDMTALLDFIQRDTYLCAMCYQLDLINTP